MFKSHQLYSTAANITRKFLSNNNRTTGEITPISATGGTVVDSGGYKIHIFTGSSTPGFDITSLGTGVVEVLVAGGGGGGGGQTGVGGGAGGSGIVIIRYLA